MRRTFAAVTTAAALAAGTTVPAAHADPAGQPTLYTAPLSSNVAVTDPNPAPDGDGFATDTSAGAGTLYAAWPRTPGVWDITATTATGDTTTLGTVTAPGPGEWRINISGGPDGVTYLLHDDTTTGTTPVFTTGATWVGTLNGTQQQVPIDGAGYRYADVLSDTAGDTTTWLIQHFNGDATTTATVTSHDHGATWATATAAPQLPASGAASVVAVGPGGETAVGWTDRYTSAQDVLNVAIRPRGGTWGAAQPVTTSTATLTISGLALTWTGAGLRATWTASGAGEGSPANGVYSATRTGGTWGTPAREDLRNSDGTAFTYPNLNAAAATPSITTLTWTHPVTGATRTGELMRNRTWWFFRDAGQSAWTQLTTDMLDDQTIATGGLAHSGPDAEINGPDLAGSTYIAAPDVYAPVIVEEHDSDATSQWYTVTPEDVHPAQFTSCVLDYGADGADPTPADPSRYTSWDDYCSWDSSYEPDGKYVLTAVARDSVGNVSTYTRSWILGSWTPPGGDPGDPGVPVDPTLPVPTVRLAGPESAVAWHNYGSWQARTDQDSVEWQFQTRIIDAGGHQSEELSAWRSEALWKRNVPVGRTVCVQARAHSIVQTPGSDAPTASAASAWTAPSCRIGPTDDRGLVRGPGRHLLAPRGGAYQHTVTRLTSRGATVRGPLASTGPITVRVYTGPFAGKVRIRVGATTLRVVNLYTRTVHPRLVRLATGDATGPVRLTSTSRWPVTVDAVAVQAAPRT